MSLTFAGCVSGPAFLVNSNLDQVDAAPGDGICGTFAGTCTLRAAIQEANALPGGNIIRVPAGTYVLTIPEPTGEGIAGGDLDVTDTLAIEPASKARPEIVSGDSFRVFDLDDGFIRLDSLVIRGGDDIEGGGIRIGVRALVWGFYLDIRDNSSFSRGGGVMNRGQFVLWNSQIRDNRTDARGGGLRASDSAHTTLWNTTVSGNAANIGGGIHNQGAASIFNTTVSGDSASEGAGGIYNDGVMTLANATVAFNESFSRDRQRPGGVWNFGSGLLVIRNTLIGQNRNSSPGAPGDCSGTFTSEGYNLIQDTVGCTLVGTTTGNVFGVDPELQALQVNVQGTPTHGYQPGSPPHNAGNPLPPGGPPPACWSEDQRGAGRSGCDSGAYDRP